jgi:hypothetical protein
MFSFLWLMTLPLLNCGGTLKSGTAGLSAQTRAQIAGMPVPPTYFGMHVHMLTTVSESWPTVHFGSYRSWDNVLNVCWPEIQRGGADSYDWSGLDAVVEKAQEEGKDFLYTLGPTPKQAWAVMDASNYSTGGCSPDYATSNEPDHDQWKKFVSKVVERYCGCTPNSHPTLRIKQYEIWNEPNLTDFLVPAAGTSMENSVEAMVEMARIAYTTIKSIDPEATVVSSPPTGPDTGIAWLTKFLGAGGGQYADVIAYHAYCFPCSAEQMGNDVARVRGIVDTYAPGKPLWDTEAGWHNQAFTDDEAAATVARAYLLNWANGAERFYFYSWDNDNWTSVKLTNAVNQNGQHYILGTTSAAAAYDQVHGWIVGAKVSCGAWQPGMWKCELTRGGGYHGYVLWTTGGSQSIALPDTWHVTQSRNLAGDAAPMAAKSMVQVGIQPVLYESVGSAN